ncbi:MAG: hypothetical protein COT90_02720 [Candidatus Diapherotrites archaeon CG10_big_fil_rev_8_21_14_0_10_31_34]|nr:MAG: hypothetical protein COT90_02720 [Candidatus Diapherotrites archaeon CG10_big_fil_rev_8_21_14_0_10_31_34]
MKIKFIALFLVLLFLPAFSFAANYENAVIYYNKACHGCTMYIEDNIEPLLESHGIKIEKKDFISEKENRIELNELSRQLGIPPQLQGHFTIIIGNKIILEGHVPEEIIEYLLESENEFEKIIVFQDEMDNAENYKAWAFKGELKEYKIDEPISAYLNWFNENKDSLETPKELLSDSLDFWQLLPLVLITGLLDGINPCAFGVLLFFIAFLYSMNRSKMEVWKVGSVFILAIFVAYFLIGLGLLQAILITGIPHLFGKISVFLMLFLALINFKDYFFYGKWFSLKMPSFATPIIKKRMTNITLVSVAVLGFLVGLCTFPCSGGIYIGILSLLAIQTTFMQGMAFLVIYNIMFVVPLIIILLVAGNKKVTEKITEWEKENKRKMKLVMGIVLLVLAAILFLFAF